MLKPDQSIMAALATGALVYGIYQMALPPVAAVRNAEAGDIALRDAEREALWIAAGVAGGVSLITGDSAPFIVGGLFAVALSWWHRKSNLIDPGTQELVDWVKNPGKYNLGEALVPQP